MFHQNRPDFEKVQSSKVSELLAVSLSKEAFVESLKTQRVTWFTFNLNVVRIVYSGPKYQHYRSLQWISIKIVHLMICNGSQET